MAKSNEPIITSFLSSFPLNYTAWLHLSTGYGKNQRRLAKGVTLCIFFLSGIKSLDNITKTERTALMVSIFRMLRDLALRWLPFPFRPTVPADFVFTVHPRDFQVSPGSIRGLAFFPLA
jgi:hypothetical protein